MKKLVAILMAALMLVGIVACTAKPAEQPADKPAEQPAEQPAAQGKVFNIYAWNEEFKGFFEKYYTVPEGVTVNWIITPSDNGAYQQKLDEALLNQANASEDRLYQCRHDV